ncbi:hypothetical protein LOK49_LG04G00371 [Camellia lanceoleosa]|uniref:Uncharacterized protein n=1 Tax=Camellia lanceoleosa TaxID=1840588 RepID=A0ACC0HWW5_9ERIC|nr:hypothetical protein LOK49_LG04G00371 [Camellia lanceoleosa]
MNNQKSDSDSDSEREREREGLRVSEGMADLLRRTPVADLLPPSPTCSISSPTDLLPDCSSPESEVVFMWVFLKFLKWALVGLSYSIRGLYDFISRC